jgi:hypothetical protein
MYIQTIDPSCISEGDTIKVLHYKQLGMELSVTGKVAVREEQGNFVVFYTEESGILLSYEIGRVKAVTVFLISRPPVKEEVLDFFNFDNEELISRFTD